jgi:hypothetical protein
MALRGHREPAAPGRTEGCGHPVRLRRNEQDIQEDDLPRAVPELACAHGRRATTDAILEDEEASHLDGAARYVGEVFRKALGGHWRLRLNDPKYVFHDLPEL